MTAGSYYDNVSFVDEDVPKLQNGPQPKPQTQPEECSAQHWAGSPDNGCGGKKLTLLTLSRSASVRYRPGASDGRSDAIGDLLAKQIDQQRQSEPPLSRNPSIRYSRRFSHVAWDGAGGGNMKSSKDVAAAAAAAAAAAVAKATNAATRPAAKMRTSAQVYAANNEDADESRSIVMAHSSAG